MSVVQWLHRYLHHCLGTGLSAVVIRRVYHDQHSSHEPGTMIVVQRHHRYPHHCLGTGFLRIQTVPSRPATTDRRNVWLQCRRGRPVTDRRVPMDQQSLLVQHVHRIQQKTAWHRWPAWQWRPLQQGWMSWPGPAQQWVPVPGTGGWANLSRPSIGYHPSRECWTIPSRPSRGFQSSRDLDVVTDSLATRFPSIPKIFNQAQVMDLLTMMTMMQWKGVTPEVTAGPAAVSSPRTVARRSPSPSPSCSGPGRVSDRSLSPVGRSQDGSWSRALQFWEFRQSFKLQIFALFKVTRQTWFSSGLLGCRSAWRCGENSQHFRRGGRLQFSKEGVPCTVRIVQTSCDFLQGIFPDHPGQVQEGCQSVVDGPWWGREDRPGVMDSPAIATGHHGIWHGLPRGWKMRRL